jgi:hypothetical protein
MTNLYDFLREINRRASADSNPLKTITISEEEKAWIERFMWEPDFELHFKATRMPNTSTEENIYSQDYAIKGDTVDIFGLFTEAMLHNTNFAKIICAAAEFFYSHANKCKNCNEIMKQGPPAASWDFTSPKEHTIL